MAKQTPSDRAKLLLDLLEDPDVNLTFPEALRHFILWVRYERALLKWTQYDRLSDKLQKRLNDNIEVYKLRRDLNVHK